MKISRMTNDTPGSYVNDQQVMSEPDGPLVSVIIDNYNYGRYLRQAVDSALLQDHSHVEVIVVDDGSTDGSRSVIADYGDTVKSVLQPNRGQSAALNAGFAASSGDVIALLNADDWFLPEKISSVVRHFAARADVQWIFDPVTMTFPDGRTLTIPNYEECPTDLYVDVRHLSPQGKLGPFAPPHSGLSFRRSLLGKLLPMTEDIRMGSDNFLKFAAMTLAPGLQLKAPLTVQRIHSSNAGTMRNDRLLQKARQHLLIARELKLRVGAANRVSNKVFAKAAADFVRARTRDAMSESAIRIYLQNCSSAELLDIVPRTVYQCFRRLGCTG